MKVARVRQHLEADIVQPDGQFKLMGAHMVLLTATKEHLLLVFESLLPLNHDSVGKVICLVDIRWESDRHQLLSVFFLKVA